jgi:hypothetical protein
MTQMDALSAKCGYTGYAAKHLTYPPKGLFPLPTGANDDDCDIWSAVAEAATLVNPAFDIYRIFDTVGYSIVLLIGSSFRHSGQYCGTFLVSRWLFSL